MNKKNKYFGIYYRGSKKPQVIMADSLGWAQTIAQVMGEKLNPNRPIQKVMRFRGNPGRYRVLPTSTIIYMLALVSNG